MKKTAGLTLIELMVTTFIMAIGILAVIGSLRYITTSIQYSKGKTMANNLVTEQVEKLKNLQYYSLLVTTSTYSDNRFTPPLLYDTGNYPSQTIIQGGITFTRGTRVDYAYQFGSSITTAPFTSDDTGLKMISVYVMWQDDANLRYQEIHNLMANPAANPLNATFTGTVLSTSGVAISGAVVKTIDNPNFYATTDGSGAYTIRVASGNYTLNCSSQGYFSADKHGTVASGGSTAIAFTLSQMAAGTASGYVYLNNHLVISQVVASTGPASDIEYIELYNPTTTSILLGSNSNPTAPNVAPILWDSGNNGYLRHLYYANGSVPANGFYLISNTGSPSGASTSCSTFTVAGVQVAPDACWKFYSAPTHLIECGSQPCNGPNSPDAGGISLGNSSAYVVVPGPVNLSNWPAASIDSIGWNQKASGLGNAAPSNAVEGTAITPASNNGLQPGEQLVRMSAAASLTSNVGRAYDANKNSTDFYAFSSVTYRPYNSTTIYAPLSGTPAVGAYVTSDDPLSSPAQCSSTGFFNLTSIATGTWTLAITSGSYYVEVTNVLMTTAISTSVPNGITSPTWPAANLNNALLNTTTTSAFVSGVVTDVNNNPISNLQVNVGGSIFNTNASGRYFASTPTGDVLIIANYNNQNKSYASQSSTLLGTSAGLVYDNPPAVSPQTWFQLPLAGTIVGYFQTSSLTALPGQTAVALSGGNQVAQAVSDNSGHFYMANLSTGTYTLSPELDPASSVSPTATVITLSSTGTATTISTFTVSTGLSQITGQALITASTAAITTGVLVMASTTSLGGTSASMPPTQNGGTGALCAPCYYGASSDSTGSYTLYVRSSTSPYQLYGWYTTFSGQTPSTTRAGPYSVMVSTADVIMSQNISW